MRVQKRGGRFEEIKFDKITDRIKNLCVDLDRTIDASKIALLTIGMIHDGIRTEELDIISANNAESYKLIHPDYSTLAARILISNLHKSTPNTFSECMAKVASCLSTTSELYYGFIAANGVALDNMIINANDYLFDYFGYKTLEHSYLIKIPEVVVVDGNTVYVDRDGNVVDSSLITMNRRGKPVAKINSRWIGLRPKTVGRIMDRPQYMHMRVAIAASLRSEVGLSVVLEKIQQCYNLISYQYYTHATPTLFNACNKMQQLASCFLQGTHDSIEGINKTKSNAGVISKWAGGEGIHMSNIRSRNQPIKGTNGKSNGIVPQLKIYNETALTFNQGGKRNGAFAIYLEPWHGDIMSFLKLKLSQGAETERTRDLFHALWIPDLFVKRLEALQDWSLFSADTAPGLCDVYDGMDVCSKCNYCVNKAYARFILEVDVDSKQTNLEGTAVPTGDQIGCDHTFAQVDAFTQLYTQYEEDGVSVGNVSCWELMKAVCNAQRESGTPYILHKDHINRCSNQKNIGTIKSSNLCVSGETNVLTDKGQFMIKDIVGPAVIWNGFEFSDVVVKQTGVQQQLLRIRFSNGVTLDCTEYHKFYILVSEQNCVADAEIVMIVDAKDLKPGDKIIKHNLPTISDGKNRISNESFESIMTASLSIKLRWFAAFCDLCGYIVSRTLVCESPHVDDVRLLLTTMGVDAKIRLGALMMNGGSTSHLIINQTGVNHLRSLGIVSKVINEAPIATDCYVAPTTVTSVTVGICDDTYCFNEPKRHLGLFNGILTGNCTEIVEYSSDTSYATCTLASINLKKFLVGSGTSAIIDHAKLHEVVEQIAENLDNVISVNCYPVEECVANARDYRPIGIGVQALADVFAAMRIPFVSPEAEKIDLEIFETIYHAALTTSCRLATERGSYTEFKGSPASNGVLAFDMWLDNQRRCNSVLKDAALLSGRYDWSTMREVVVRKGLRNSLLIAPMPTVSTSQILGNNESFEPFSSNIYTKGTLAGKFTVSNRAMISHLIELGLWDDKMKNRIITAGGSVQNIDQIPPEVRKIYLTVWEIKQIELMRRAALRQAFIDQSQSLNIHLADNSDNILRSVFVAGWKFGLKSGSYYIRTKPAANAMKNNIAAIRSEAAKVSEAEKLTESARYVNAIADTVAVTFNQHPSEQEIMGYIADITVKPIVGNTAEDDMVCNMEEGCLMCGS